ncbi:MAG TPA: sorbosone dehydrogenase family protein [Gemmatimonadaceae bacterium]|jgi:glucose/arabinose dehydrogenase|nr:sorbosone dehydrogenase family protein [Gemmatimonadaceae bacterium]
MRARRIVWVLVAASACARPAQLSVADGTGPSPALPDARTSLIPTVKVAPAKGWGNYERPTGASGTVVNAFAKGLDHPRWLYVLPNGDVLVAETNAPKRPDDGKGIRAWFVRRYMNKAGAAVPSANRITLLRDADGDGVAEVRRVLLDSLNSPFGMAYRDGGLYVANTDAVLRFPFDLRSSRVTGAPNKVVDLPAGTINHHWTKNILLSDDGSTLYATVGSNSNAAENGLEAERDRAAIWRIDLRTGAHRVYASGLRNPNGLAWEPTTGALWAAVNERDELGSDLVPDYITSVRDGGFYGWPFSYYGQHVDKRVKDQRPDLVASAVVPDFAMGPHTASLGLAWSPSESALPPSLRDGLIVGQHGSWNRKPPSGYKVVFVPFTNGKPSGMPVAVLTGFLDADGNARGRPVGVALDARGALLVADDVGNAIWRVVGSQTLTKGR